MSSPKTSRFFSALLLIALFAAVSGLSSTAKPPEKLVEATQDILFAPLNESVTIVNNGETNITNNKPLTKALQFSVPKGGNFAIGVSYVNGSCFTLSQESSCNKKFAWQTEAEKFLRLGSGRHVELKSGKTVSLPFSATHVHLEGGVGDCALPRTPYNSSELITLLIETCSASIPLPYFIVPKETPLMVPAPPAPTTIPQTTTNSSANVKSASAGGGFPWWAYMLIFLLLVALIGGGIGGYFWYRHQKEKKEPAKAVSKKGSKKTSKLSKKSKKEKNDDAPKSKTIADAPSMPSNLSGAKEPAVSKESVKTDLSTVPPATPTLPPGAASPAPSAGTADA